MTTGSEGQSRETAERSGGEQSAPLVLVDGSNVAHSSEGDQPDLMFCGLWYLDTVVRTPEGWRIKERVEKKSYMRFFPGKS